MKESDRMEVIVVRLNNCLNTSSFQGIIKELVDRNNDRLSQSNSIKLYKNEKVDNDWTIYLHNPAIGKRGKSSLAISLTEALKTVGLVNHTVWKSCDAGHLGKMFTEQ